MLRVEYTNQIPHYTVYDQYRLVVVSTGSFTVARDFEYLVQRGHTARTLYILAKKVSRTQAPLRRY